MTPTSVLEMLSRTPFDVESDDGYYIEEDGEEFENPDYDDPNDEVEIALEERRESDEATNSELSGFKKGLGERGKGRSINQLKEDFVRSMERQPNESWEAFSNRQKRVKSRPPKDFAVLLASISDEEE
jgi:hypothetical protein